MGEPPANINTEVDGNDRLRRMYYQQAPKPHNHIRLGHAVAASACVPGIFEPLALPNLYPEKVVRLVDGGVHDNQGTGGLLGEECTVVLVSDASGQMGTTNNPGPGLFGVSIRSNSILMARVRDSEFRELEARRRSSLLRGLMFIHLKKDLEVDPVDWIGCDDPYEAFDEAHTPERRGTVTSYGVRKDVQQSLSSIRTDLDSFSDKEAFALMLSGYRMAAKEFAESIKGFPPVADERPQWRFLSIEKQMDRVKGFEDAHQDLMDSLRVGSSRILKVWKLNSMLPTALLVGCLTLVGVFAAIYVKSQGLQTIVSTIIHFFSGLAASTGTLLSRLASEFVEIVNTPYRAIFTTLMLFALLNIVFQIVRVIRRHKPLGQIAFGLVMATVGWLLASLHLLVLDKLFLARGRVTEPTPQKAQSTT